MPEPVVLPAHSPVRLTFVGDVNLGTSTLPGGVPPDTGRALFGSVDTLLTGDLVVGNFEGVLADSGTSTKCRKRANCYVFLTPTRLAPRLIDAGFTHLNLANNHANDYGARGLASTMATLEGLGLTVYGPGTRMVVDSLRRADTTVVVGVIGFATYPFAPNLLDIPRSVALVDSIRPLVDLLVITFHGGTEGDVAIHTADGPEDLFGEARGDLRRWARAVLDAGADAVVGHGPHVLRGIEFYHGKPIFYSLGNFLTYRGFSLSGNKGVTGVLQLELAPDGGFVRARLVPLRQIPGAGLLLDPPGAAIDLVRRLSREDFGPRAAVIDSTGVILPPAIEEPAGP